MNLKVQRFQLGHPFYSDAKISFDGKDYQANFGQLVDEEGHRICYTMERRDTLIPEGKYPYTFYFSPLNKCTVPLLHDVPGFEYIELHVANFPYEVKGCTALGEQIDVGKPSIAQSRIAFNYLMGIIENKEGTVTYEKFVDETLKSENGIA